VGFRTRAAIVIIITLAVLPRGDLSAAKNPFKNLATEQRLDAMRRAQVWQPTDVSKVDIEAGPENPKGFVNGETVTCNYVPRKITGTPKFYCEVAPGDIVKVKYGEDNGEVYAEVAATRLLWALGFGADRMYPVTVNCRGCGVDPAKTDKIATGETHVFDPAVIEREMPGESMETRDIQGWDWIELNYVDETIGGAPVAQRDALKLLAVFMQHTDSKSAQQRLVCLDKHVSESSDSMCAHPFMMLNDVGKTFGKANLFNRNEPGAVDLKAWSSMAIWKDKNSCVGNLPKSYTGSLFDPKISEPGRQFLANLLSQLSDDQIYDLFEVARVARRQPSTTVDDWVGVFRKKRDEITSRSCGS
jgi:hypothetical protein